MEIGENIRVPHHPNGYRGGWVHYMGNLVMKSIVTISHFHSRMGNDYRNIVGCLYSSFTFCHSRHLAL
jgi:hypothetical protein